MRLTRQTEGSFLRETFFLYTQKNLTVLIVSKFVQLSAIKSLSLSFSPRGFHHLLAPILHHSHPEHALRLQHPPSNVQRLYVAWICQQCCQPNYLHHLQH